MNSILAMQRTESNSFVMTISDQSWMSSTQPLRRTPQEDTIPEGSGIVRRKKREQKPKYVPCLGSSTNVCREKRSIKKVHSSVSLIALLVRTGGRSSYGYHCCCCGDFHKDSETDEST